MHAAVDGGLISVAGDRVSILAEHAVLAEDISVEDERKELEEAQALDTDDDQREHRIRAPRRASGRPRRPPERGRRATSRRRPSGPEARRFREAGSRLG